MPPLVEGSAASYFGGANRPAMQTDRSIACAAGTSSRNVLTTDLGQVMS